jgi:hypothetical protein
MARNGQKTAIGADRWGRLPLDGDPLISSLDALCFVVSKDFENSLVSKVIMQICNILQIRHSGPMF